MAKVNKSSRFGMRVSPDQKERWEATAKAWGYKSTSEWLAAMADWAIEYDKFDGSYNDYVSGTGAKAAKIV